jgi:dolichol-phosphate mannosyltransferase
VSLSASVILPTRNEEQNIAEVLLRLDRQRVCDQLVVVDDSDDATATMALELRDELDAELIVYQRRGHQRHGGLGTAILDGIERSSGLRIVVMDADLQHPPELVPELLQKLDDVELAIASRFNWDNVIAGLSPVRRAASKAAGALAFRMFPEQLVNVSDPMSGFFACRRSAITTSRLEPMGYKILLEILGTHPDLSRAEIPFSFGHRSGGQSKAGLSEGIRYLRHLAALNRRSRNASAAAVISAELA